MCCDKTKTGVHVKWTSGPVFGWRCAVGVWQIVWVCIREVKWYVSVFSVWHKRWTCVIMSGSEWMCESVQKWVKDREMGKFTCYIFRHYIYIYELHEIYICTYL
jgi:hypothetical protein